VSPRTPRSSDDFAPSAVKLLWVVRPCLWLELNLRRKGGGGVCSLLMAPFSFISDVKMYNRGVNRPHWGRRGFPLLCVRLVRLVESPPLRLFIPHLCHAACRIVIMAEDTERLLGGGVGHCDDGRGVIRPFTYVYISVGVSGKSTLSARGGRYIKSGVVNKGGVCVSRKAFRYVRSSV